MSKTSLAARRAEAGLVAAGALVCAGLAAAMVYETWAILGGGPTISGITADKIERAPKIAGGSIFGAGALFGALAAHFTNWRP